MMKPINVSVLMPAWNAERTISESIDSILAQTYRHFELIVIDDDSSDSTWKLLQNYLGLDNRIRLYRNETNLGIAASRNRALSLATGRYIAWQDADDISYPNRLNLQFNALENDSQIGIIGASIEFFDDRGIQSTRKYEQNDNDIRSHIFRYSPVAQPVAMIRKECFDRVGLYDLRYPPAEDLDMNFRIGTHYKFANLDQPLLKYRISSTSATYRKLFKIELSTFQIRAKNIRNSAYKFRLLDILFNLVQYTLVIWIPPKVKISLFNLIRNSPVSRTTNDQ